MFLKNPKWCIIAAIKISIACTLVLGERKRRCGRTTWCLNYTSNAIQDDWKWNIIWLFLLRAVKRGIIFLLYWKKGWNIKWKGHKWQNSTVRMSSGRYCKHCPQCLWWIQTCSSRTGTPALCNPSRKRESKNYDRPQLYPLPYFLDGFQHMGRALLSRKHKYNIFRIVRTEAVEAGDPSCRACTVSYSHDFKA